MVNEKDGTSRMLSFNRYALIEHHSNIVVAKEKEMDLVESLIMIVVLLIGWIILSIPLWLAAKVLTGGDATMGKAMLGMLLGGLVFLFAYAVVYIFTDIFTSAGVAMLVASIIGFLSFLGLYKVLFKVGWIIAFVIAILAVIFAVVMVFITGALLVI
jgi:hypothetical protein